jgi:2-(3-amino-3-carboxypropyl)histidine synthase
MENKFDFKEDFVVEQLKDKKIKLALLQLPEGLKMEASRLANYFEKHCDTEIVVSGEACWGACDLSLDEAKNLGADILIHYGHAPFIKNVEFPVIYIEMKDKTPIINLIEKSVDSIKNFKKLGLVCSIQHIHQIEEVKKFYEHLGKTVSIPPKKGFAHYDGHVVGCEYNSLKTISKEVDAFVVIGNQFHSLGAALAVTNPVFLLDTYNQEVVDMSPLRDKVRKQRFAAIERVRNSKKVGIIVGMKPGQKFGSFKVIKKKYEAAGKEVVVLTMSEITKDKLVNFNGINAFVELACPRIAVEDYDRYDQALVTFRESLVAIGELKWEDLMEHGFL